MTTKLRAVLFDMGGTIENLYYTDATRAEATHGLQQVLADKGVDPHLPLPELQSTVLAGMKAYAEWREQTERELPPERVWPEYIFPNHGIDKQRLCAAAEDITFYYEGHFHVRSMRPEAPAALAGLAACGFRLAIISNILGCRIVPAKLDEYGLAHYFYPVLTSAGVGWRKPNPRIFLEAAHLLDLPPAACAYVGDTISRDVVGPHRSGYGMAIQIRSFLTDKMDKPTDTDPPDAVISDLTQVIALASNR